MADNTQTLINHYKKAIRNPESSVIFTMSSTNPKLWYILIRNIGGFHDEYQNGEFLFSLEATDKFPFSPPRFHALTPNGVYEKDQICCISIGQYHVDQYPSAMGMRGFAIDGLANGLINHKNLLESGGINLIRTTESQKKAFAKESRQFNWKTYPEQMKLLESAYESYALNWDLATMKSQVDTISKYNFGKLNFTKIAIEKSRLELLSPEERKDIELELEVKNLTI
jgi:hypothetical protein